MQDKVTRIYFGKDSITNLWIVGMFQKNLVSAMFQERSHTPSFDHYCCGISFTNSITDCCKQDVIRNLHANIFAGNTI